MSNANQKPRRLYVAFNCEENVKQYGMLSRLNLASDNGAGLYVDISEQIFASISMLYEVSSLEENLFVVEEPSVTPTIRAEPFQWVCPEFLHTFNILTREEASQIKEHYSKYYEKKQ